MNADQDINPHAVDLHRWCWFCNCTLMTSSGALLKCHRVWYRDQGVFSAYVWTCIACLSIAEPSIGSELLRCCLFTPLHVLHIGGPCCEERSGQHIIAEQRRHIHHATHPVNHYR